MIFGCCCCLVGSSAINIEKEKGSCRGRNRRSGGKKQRNVQSPPCQKIQSFLSVLKIGLRRQEGKGFFGGSRKSIKVAHSAAALCSGVGFVF